MLNQTIHIDISKEFDVEGDLWVKVHDLRWLPQQKATEIVEKIQAIAEGKASSSAVRSATRDVLGEIIADWNLGPDFPVRSAAKHEDIDRIPFVVASHCMDVATLPYQKWMRETRENQREELGIEEAPVPLRN